jgi:hypothetical protein
MYCDLVFNNCNDEFINWIEKLEEKCQQLIHGKSDDWFENGLDKTDIESAFTSPIRLFKSGKNYLLRSNVKINQVSSLPLVKIYNENEEIVTTDDVNDETNIISILEFSGIKFTSRNFQIHIEVKQMMILNNDKIFEKCLIKYKKPDQEQEEDVEEKPDQEQKEDVEEKPDQEQKKDVEEKSSEHKQKQNEVEEKSFEEKQNEVQKEELEEVSQFNLEEEPLEISEDLVEVDPDFNLDSIEAIHLKKPNQVYYEMYKVARQKAKEAKKSAIIAFLEAKNIKKTYMLDDLDDSDSDTDTNNYLES